MLTHKMDRFDEVKDEEKMVCFADGSFDLHRAAFPTAARRGN